MPYRVPFRRSRDVCIFKMVSLLFAILGTIVMDGINQASFAAFSCGGTINSVAFGNVDTTSSLNDDSTNTLTLSCTESPVGGTIRFCINISGGSASDTTSRMMASGANRLRYQLYSDAAHTAPWGSWSSGIFGGGVTWDISCTSSTCGGSRTIYGRVPGSQTSVPTGSYSSTLSISLTYNDTNTSACPSTGKGTLTGNFTATATVVPMCQVSATNLNFGSVGLLNSAVDQTNSVNVTCTNGTSYNVGLGAGNGSGATVAARKMTKTATTNTTTYSLYRNSSRSQIWGTTIGTDTQTGTGTGSAQSHTVYGRVPSQTTPPPGVYTDTIVVTVTY